MIIILALLNDLPILTIAYDRVITPKKPVRWNMFVINSIATAMGVAGVLESFLILFVLFKIYNLPIDLIQSLVFLKLAVEGHGTLYNVRVIDRNLWKRPWPSPILWAATFSTRVAGTIIGVYGFGLMTPTGWGWALFIWGYALICLIVNDYLKLAVWKLYEHKKFIFAPHHFEFLKKVFSA